MTTGGEGGKTTGGDGGIGSLLIGPVGSPGFDPVVDGDEVPGLGFVGVFSVFPVPPDGTPVLGVGGETTTGGVIVPSHGTIPAVINTAEPGGKVVLEEVVEPSVPKVVIMIVMAACVEAAACGVPK